MFMLPAVYVFCLGALTVYQTRCLWSENDKREAFVYILSMAISAVVGTLLIAGVNVPSLVMPFKIVFESVGKALLNH